MYISVEFPVSIPASNVAENCVQQLLRTGQTVALAESCTGGLVAKTITDIAGASNVFECGVVSYSNRIKSLVLGVLPETIEQYSVVSPEVAVEMACGVRTLSGASYGIGITGVAGPGPDGPHPEGEIYLALSDGSNNFVVSIPPEERGRTANRQLAAEQALSLLAVNLLEHE